MFELGLQERQENIAAFLLHQTAERLFTTALLVFTSYKPKIHNIEKLWKMASDQHSAFRFPLETTDDRRLFDLLKRAYVDARYSKNYRVTEAELTALAARVRLLRERTESACAERIAGRT